MITVKKKSWYSIQIETSPSTCTYQNTKMAKYWSSGTVVVGSAAINLAHNQLGRLPQIMVLKY